MVQYSMSKENKQILQTRAKAFLWRYGMIGLAFGLDFITTNLGLFNLPMPVTLTVGVVLGEVSKCLNNKYDLEQYLRPATK